MILVAREPFCKEFLLCFVRLVEVGNKSQMLKYYGLRCMPAFLEVESFLKLCLPLTCKFLASQWQITESQNSRGWK